MSSGEMLGIAALVLSVLLGALLAVQTVRLGRVERQLRALMKGGGPGAASLSFGELLARQGERLETTREETESLRQAVTRLEFAVARSVQNVALVRYNPFQDTGGDQSFALALLDRHGDGVVLSSLHNRTGTRFYAKPVQAASSPLGLSDEEAQAMQQAMKQG